MNFAFKKKDKRGKLVVEVLDDTQYPSFDTAWDATQGLGDSWHRATVRLALMLKSATQGWAKWVAFLAEPGAISIDDVSFVDEECEAATDPNHGGVGVCMPSTPAPPGSSPENPFVVSHGLCAIDGHCLMSPHFPMSY